MLEERTNTLLIRTPEGVVFPLPLAGPVTRFFAWSIDLACISVATMMLTYLLSPLMFIVPDFTFATLALLYFALSIGYGILTEWYWRGQTLGKRLLHLRVVDEQGLRLQFSQVALRNLLRFVDALPALYLVGGIACLVNRHAQRLGDYAANTIVVRSRPGLGYDLEQLGVVKYNSFREHPHLEARLRQAASPLEASVALQALVRRGELEPLPRVDLFRDVADHFRALVTFPDSATFGLTDEHYVRNVVDTLFRTGVGPVPGPEGNPASSRRIVSVSQLRDGRAGPSAGASPRG